MKMFRFVDIYCFVSVADATEDANGCRHSESTGQFVSGSGKGESPIIRSKEGTNSPTEKVSIPADRITSERISHSVRVSQEKLNSGSDPESVILEFCKSLRGVADAKLKGVKGCKVTLSARLGSELKNQLAITRKPKEKTEEGAIKAKISAKKECADYIFALGKLPEVLRDGEYSDWQVDFHPNHQGKPDRAFCYVTYKTPSGLEIQFDIKAEAASGASIHSLITSGEGKRWKTKQEKIKAGEDHPYKEIGKLLGRWENKDSRMDLGTVFVVGVHVRRRSR